MQHHSFFKNLSIIYSVIKEILALWLTVDWDISRYNHLTRGDYCRGAKFKMMRVVAEEINAKCSQLLTMQGSSKTYHGFKERWMFDVS